jgi:large subunit ribosomal protein L24
MKIRKGDTVQIQKGKDKEKTGKVVAVLVKAQKVLVEGMNQYKRHVKARTQNQKSEIITITKPLHASSLAVVCPKCKKPTRIGYQMINKEKVRICRKCKQTI